MKLTKQQRVYAAVLGLALVALFVDRVFLGGGTGPSTAVAAESLLVKQPTPATERSAPAPAPTLAAASSPSPRLAPSADVVSIADRLRTLMVPNAEPADPGQLDAFSVPASWGDPFGKPGQATSRDQSGTRTYKLTSVLRNRSTNALLAVINGRGYAQGDRIDDLTVGEVTEQAVTLEAAGGRTIELRIESPDNDAHPTSPKPGEASPHSGR